LKKGPCVYRIDSNTDYSQTIIKRERMVAGKMAIKKVRLGRTEIQATQLGFGSIPIQRLNEADAVAVIRHCLDLGINFIDTANAYTTSEERIGKAIAGRRQQVYIATKSMAGSIDVIKKNLELSLKRLNTDYIDLYQLHGVSDQKTLDRILGPEGLLPYLETVKKEGLIRHIGITSHQIDIAAKAVESGCFETIMFPFNFMTTEASKVLFPVCRQQDTGFIAMKPLAGGMIDNAAICFKFLMQIPEIVFIPGIEKIEEIDEIAGIIQGSPELTDEEKAAMQRIKEELGDTFCHRCDYCQPCTAGIPISMVMTLKGFYKRVPRERFFGEMVGPAMEKAAGCTECGKCEERCPYHLHIRQMIGEQVAWYQAEKKKYLERA